MAIRGLPCITSASAIEGDTQKVDKLKKSCVILDRRGRGRKKAGYFANVICVCSLRRERMAAMRAAVMCC